jgi:hypothetical protein
MMIAELLEFGKRHKERERERVCLFEGSRYSQNAILKIKSAKIMYLL